MILYESRKWVRCEIVELNQLKKSGFLLHPIRSGGNDETLIINMIANTFNRLDMQLIIWISERILTHWAEKSIVEL